VDDPFTRLKMLKEFRTVRKISIYRELHGWLLRLAFPKGIWMAMVDEDYVLGI